MNRKLLAALITTLGAGALVYGVALIFVPAALILAGALMMAAGLLPDWEA